MTAPTHRGEVIVVQHDEDVVSTCDTCPDLQWDGLAGAIAAYRHTEETTHTTRTVRSVETYRGWVADTPESGEGDG
jgi:hypothetical protein